MYSCLCVLWSDKQLSHIALVMYLIPVGQRKKAWNHIVMLTGGGFLSVRVCWLRWDFMWKQQLLALSCGIPADDLSGRHAVPRHILTPMLLFRLTWFEAQ